MIAERSVPLFVNGEGMRGRSVHTSIAGHPPLGTSATAPHYRYSSLGDRFPALGPTATEGVRVPRELYNVPFTAIRDVFIRAQPQRAG